MMKRYRVKETGEIGTEVPLPVVHLGGVSLYEGMIGLVFDDPLCITVFMLDDLEIVTEGD